MEDVAGSAKEAYIYGFPMVESYRIELAYFEDLTKPENKARAMSCSIFPGCSHLTARRSRRRTWIRHTHGLGWTGAPSDWFHGACYREVLLLEPAVIDLYIDNFDYLGSRTTGNGGGSFAVGAELEGDVPEGITKVIRSETDILSAQFRTQLFSPDDLENVKAIQQQYIVQPLSAFRGQPAPPAPSGHRLLATAEPRAQRTSLRSLSSSTSCCSLRPHTRPRSICGRVLRRSALVRDLTLTRPRCRPK